MSAACGYCRTCARAEESLSRTRLSPSGRLRVDAPTGLASDVLIPALPDFFSRYPDIQLELGCSDRTIDLIEEGVDCAVRGGQLADSNLIARRVGILNFVTCATPEYLSRYGRPAHPDELVRHRCVNYFSSRTGKLFDWDFARNGERVQVALPGHIAVNDTNAYVAAGLAGLGIVQMPNFTLEPMLGRRPLRAGARRLDQRPAAGACRVSAKPPPVGQGARVCRMGRRTVFQPSGHAPAESVAGRARHPF